MTSYKSVVKCNYTQNPADVVALREYILFEDAKANVRYAVLKFVNNLDQKLFGMQFEVYQHDGDGNVLAKSIVVYDKFTCGQGETFVPKAKLKLSINCQSISVKLLSAQFDRARYENGTLAESNYPFERYVQDVRVLPTQPRGASAPAIAAQPTQRKPQKQYAFRVRETFKQNYAVFPKVFTVLVALIFVAAVVLGTLWFGNTSKDLSIGAFDVRVTSGNAVCIVRYDGKETDLTIPATLKTSDVEYAVERIATGAFRNSPITKITFASSKLEIDKNAFYNCKKLETVSGTKSRAVTVLGYAFNNCTAIKEIDLPYAVVHKNSFYGSHDAHFEGQIDLQADSVDEVFGIVENDTTKKEQTK